MLFFFTLHWLCTAIFVPHTRGTKHIYCSAPLCHTTPKYCDMHQDFAPHSHFLCCTMLCFSASICLMHHSAMSFIYNSQSMIADRLRLIWLSLVEDCCCRYIIVVFVEPGFYVTTTYLQKSKTCFW